MDDRKRNTGPPASETLSGDALLMRRALDLAARGIGRTSPNPPVGCVIVRDRQVVGEGFHARAGESHAEVIALREAGENARGATAFVTLEPCAHHGRTPPCTDALLTAGIGRVVVAAEDPNPLVAGRGIERLRAAGVDVRVGVLENEAVGQQEVFRHWFSAGRPLVVYKFAVSLDGKTATGSGDSRWVSGPASRERVQLLRDELDAVVVGIGTVLADDPALTCRLAGPAVPGREPRDPVKVVLDSAARTPATARLLEPGARGEPARVVVVTVEGADERRLRDLRAAGAQVALVPAGEDGRVALGPALSLLGERGLRGLLLEGGSRLAGAFLDAGLVDRVVAFVAPKLVGGGGPTPAAGRGAGLMAQAIRLEDVSVERSGDDVLIEGRVPRDWEGGRRVHGHS